jgi:hypothetical protein
MAVFDKTANAEECAIATGGICLAACLSLMAIGFKKKQTAL